MFRIEIRRVLSILPLSPLMFACGTQPMGVKENTAQRSAALSARSEQDDADREADDCVGHAEHDDPAERERAEKSTSWQCGKKPGKNGSVAVKILGFNDFHGHLAEGSKVGGRPVGGASVLASYLKSAMTGIEKTSLIIHAGDHVGASPPESALLQDEPSIQFLNTLTNGDCEDTDGKRTGCNIIGTLGNHEFDEGKAELLRLLNGGNFATGPFLQNPYPGANYPYVNSNVFVQSNKKHATDRNLILPYAIRKLGGVKVGIIGAVLKETPTIVTSTGVAGLTFADEADSINAQVCALKDKGVHSIIVTIHQGSAQSPTYTGPTDAGATVGSPIADIVTRLDDEVDLVISGHSHTFTNALVPNTHGHPILVVQAFSYGTAYDDVDLVLDRSSGDVLSKSARIVTTYSDVAPGNVRDPAVQTIVDAAVAKVAPLVNREVTTIDSDITRSQAASGESTLGNLIADAQRAAMGTDFAFMNPGGIRADLTYAANASNPLDADGLLLWGELFTVQPFGNSLVRINMTGQQVVDVLNQQWPAGRVLQISGLEYTWDASQPAGSRIVQVRKGATPIDLSGTYSVTVNNFLVAGGDGFTVFELGTNQVGGAIDLDALVEYLQDQPQPVAAPALGRIVRLN